MSIIDFNNKVVVVTGAGGSLGRAYALEFAKRGANVLVNDFISADQVVEEIKAFGGIAVANNDSVENGEKIIEAAITAFGRVDIVINNAGILRDISFAKMSDKDWADIYKVHVDGAYKVTRAAWPHMAEQRFGRIIFTSSAAGIFGNFGQANYSSAKSALIGLGKTLAIEGQKRNIFSNIIAPMAGSQMTETILPEEILAHLKPELVVPLVIKLCSENNTENGSTFEVGAGWFSKLRYQRSQGLMLDSKDKITAEMIEENWEKVVDFTNASNPSTVADTFNHVSKHIGIDMLAALK